MNFRASLFYAPNSKKIRKCPKKRPELKGWKIYDIFFGFLKKLCLVKKNSRAHIVPQK